VNAETVETVQIETIRQHCWQMLTKPSRIGRKCEKAMAESKHDMDELTERSLYPPRRPRMGTDVPCKIDRQNKAENLFPVCSMQRVCADQASVRSGVSQVDAQRKPWGSNTARYRTRCVVDRCCQTQRKDGGTRKNRKKVLCRSWRPVANCNCNLFFQVVVVVLLLLDIGGRGLAFAGRGRGAKFVLRVDASDGSNPGVRFFVPLVAPVIKY